MPSTRPYKFLFPLVTPPSQRFPFLSGPPLPVFSTSPPPLRSLFFYRLLLVLCAATLLSPFHDPLSCCVAPSSRASFPTHFAFRFFCSPSRPPFKSIPSFFPPSMSDRSYCRHDLSLKRPRFAWLPLFETTDPYRHLFETDFFRSACDHVFFLC